MIVSGAASVLASGAASVLASGSVEWTGIPTGALLGFAGLMLVNGFFVAVEFALLASMRSRIERLRDDRRPGARWALSAMGRVGLVLAATQLGITVASLLLGEIAEPAVGSILEHLLGSALSEGVRRSVSLVVALVIVVFLHTLLGEMVPKSLALAKPEQSLLLTAGPMLLMITVLRPVIATLNWLAGLGARPFGVAPGVALREARTSAEISMMMAESRQEGLLADSEHDLLTGALGVVVRTVSTAMLPRDRIVSVPRSTPVAEIEEVIRASGLSRVVITGRDLDDVIGFVHVKDLLRLPPEAGSRPLPTGVFRATLVVTAGERLGEVLLAMREQRRHVAVVVSGDAADDATRHAGPMPGSSSAVAPGGSARPATALPVGRTVGMVTLEDILESIVGEIFDESDQPLSEES